MEATLSKNSFTETNPGKCVLWAKSRLFVNTTVCLAFHFPPGDYTFQAAFSSVTKPSSITPECPPETEENWSPSKKGNEKVLICFARTVAEVVFKNLIIKIYLGGLCFVFVFIFLIRVFYFPYKNHLAVTIWMLGLPVHEPAPQHQLCQPPNSFPQKHLI